MLGVEASRAAFERQRARGDALRDASLAAIATKRADAGTLAFWRHRLAKERLYYEAFTAAAYAAAHGVPLHFLAAEGADGGGPAEAGEAGEPGAPADAGAASDDPAAEFRHADGAALAALAAHDWRAAYAADYARARIDLEAKACLEFLLPVAQQPAYRERDRQMSRRITALLAGGAGPASRMGAGGGGSGPGGPGGPGGPARRVAVVCALTHLYFSEARLTIYSQLYEATTGRYITDAAGAIADHPIALPWLPQSP